MRAVYSAAFTYHCGILALPKRLKVFGSNQIFGGVNSRVRFSKLVKLVSYLNSQQTIQASN